MVFRWEVFRSVEDVWIVWLLGATLMTYLIVRAGRQRRWRNFSGFLTSERGAAYALPYVLTFPIYLLIICVMIQATMILMVKMGTMYAAYASARSAVVWRSAEVANAALTESDVQDRARKAAALAMVPFASSHTPHYAAIVLFRPMRLSEASQLFLDYELTYQKLALQNVSADQTTLPNAIIPAEESKQPARMQYVRNKFFYAFMATDVELQIPKNEFNADATAEVSFVMPMHIPGAGRILGTWWDTRRFYARTIRSSVTLPLETPLSDNRKLGIPYDSTAN